MQNGPDFDKLIAPFIEIYQNIERDLLIKIASHFKLYEDIGFKNSMEWYIKKIEELGGLNQEAVEIISKYSKIPKSKIIKMLKEAGLSTLDIEVVEKLNKVRPYKIDIDKLMVSETFNDIVNNSYKEVNEIFKLINTKAIEGTKEAYMSVLNQAYTEVSSGIFDYNTSVSKAINKMVDNGITVAQYKQKDGSIRRYSIDSCIRRDVLTAVVQCTNKASDIFINELQAEYVEVSQHLGARVTDANDYTNHSWWQGKVYKLVESTSEYPNFQETCNEGDIQGIGGVNCRHLKWAFFPGISVPKAIRISEEENQKLYNQQQTQRKYEKKIRLYKNKIDSFKEIGDTSNLKKYKTKLKNINDEYNNYCDTNDLKRNYVNERNIAQHTSKNINLNNKSKIDNKPFEDVTQKRLEKVTPNSHKIKDLDYWIIDNKKVIADGKNIVLDYKKDSDEYKCAEWLKNTFGGEIFMCPRVNKPDGISTPDYLWNNEKWDLKSLTGSGKRALEDLIKKKEKQAHNFIIDTSKSKLNDKEIQNQVEKLFDSKTTEWVEQLIVKNAENFKVYKKRG